MSHAPIESTWRQKISLYSQLTRQDKPIGTLLLLGSTSWGLIVAGSGQHSPLIICVFIVCAWLMRSAGCIINDIADRNFDKYVKRTQNRPITKGEVSLVQALMLFSLFSLSALLISLLLLRIEVLYGTLICFVLVVIYPFMKRFVWWPQLFLALAFSSAIPMAFLAYHGKVLIPGWAMFVLSSLWIFCYDSIYAMCDRDDDRRIGIKSTALWLGNKTPTLVAILQGLFLSGWVMAGLSHQAKVGFWFALIISAVLFIYQYWLCQQAQLHNDPDKFLKAFKNNHWVGWAIALGLLTFNYPFS